MIEINAFSQIATLWKAGTEYPPGQELTRQASLSNKPETAPQKDNVEISPDGRALASAENQTQKPDPGSSKLSASDENSIQELKEKDRQVRAHEQAHLTTAGNLAKGGAHFDYETAPDGKRYAVSGEVSIDSSPVEGDPEATLGKAAHVKRAALAPSDPSAQDRAVAAQAETMAAHARIELTRKQQETSGNGGVNTSSKVNMLI